MNGEIFQLIPNDWYLYYASHMDCLFLQEYKYEIIFAMQIE